MSADSFKFLTHTTGLTTVSTFLLILGGLPAAAQTTTIPAAYQSLNGGFPDGISADGTAVVGVKTFAGGEHAFRFSPATGTLIDLGTLGGNGSGNQDYVDADGFSSEALAVNADGSVVVGAALTAANLVHAFRWTTAGMVDLGTLGGSTSSANGVNADGSVVVGNAATARDAAQHAFRWTLSSNAMADLGTLGGTNSYANGVNSDGTVVVGYSDVRGNVNQNAFRWTVGSGMTSLGTLGGAFSTATAVNADGSVVVGYANPTASTLDHAFRWTSTNGMADLGTLAGGSYSGAYAVSAHGAVVVGFANVADASSNPATPSNERGFRWTQAGGMVSVDNWLRSQGVHLANDITLSAQGVSADGNVIVGQTQDYTGYLARGATTITIPGGVMALPAGLMNTATYQQSLAGTQRFNAAVRGADMAINGDNSSPMYALLHAGQSSVWTSGDLGRVNGKVYDATAAVGEIGVAHSPAEGIITRIAVGRTYTKSSLVQGGDSQVRGTYLLPEATVALGHQFYGTLTGYANWGDLATQRGYANGDGRDLSASAVGTQTYGFRTRLDWLKAYRIAAIDLSPYASFTRTSTYVGHFTEAGGAFPAFFNGGTQNADVARLGSDAELPLTSWFSLLGRAEYAHRFESHDGVTSGTVLGLSDFTLAGGSVQQNWVRGAVGAKAVFGPGEGFLLFNASSQTAGATYWVNANYRIVF